jgi:hypothetical protein
MHGVGSLATCRGPLYCLCGQNGWKGEPQDYSMTRTDLRDRQGVEPALPCEMQ